MWLKVHFLIDVDPKAYPVPWASLIFPSMFLRTTVDHRVIDLPALDQVPQPIVSVMMVPCLSSSVMGRFNTSTLGPV